MLKIKESVNLKELEKFGFEKYDYGEYIFGDEQGQHLYIESDKNVGIYVISSYMDNDLDDELLDKLFDLIQAGLVEKVVEEW